MSLVTICFTVAACALVCAALPAPPAQPDYTAHATHLQQIAPLEYYLDNPDIIKYYTTAQQRQVDGRAEAGAKAASVSSSAPSSLETLEPDSEVELIPGAQQPQPQPPQTPVAPNIPGLIPGQRVFIVHMPVPGYRPGTIGGYQPVYIVAAAPPGNYANGLQNTLLVDPSGHVVSPASWPRLSVPASLHRLKLAPQLGYRPVDVLHRSPISYWTSPDGTPSAVRLVQPTALHAQPPAHAALRTGGTASSSKAQVEEYESEETKENEADSGSTGNKS